MDALAAKPFCMKKYTHVSAEERFVIEKLLGTQMRIRGIAEVLGRSPNTISREVERNSVYGVYTAQKADHKAYATRWWTKRDCLKEALHAILTSFLTEILKHNRPHSKLRG